MLSNFSRLIQLLRSDDNRKEIFILAGEQGNIAITIFERENWRYNVLNFNVRRNDEKDPISKSPFLRWL